MPVVRFTITKGASREQKRTLVARTTDLLLETLGKRPEHTHVILEEVEEQSWGFSGMLTDEYRAIDVRSGSKTSLDAAIPNADRTALLVIDMQLDYFADGLFPLWKAEEVAKRTSEVMRKARTLGYDIVVVEHAADPARGDPPFFRPGTQGEETHVHIAKAVENIRVLKKGFADAFYQTGLRDLLRDLSVGNVLMCGMMTHNCVTHTALSPAAGDYNVSIIADCCTSTSELMHMIALDALSARCRIIGSNEI